MLQNQSQNPLLPIFKKCHLYLDNMSSPYNLLFEMMRNYQLALNEMSTMQTGQLNPVNPPERIHFEYSDKEIQTQLLEHDVINNKLVIYQQQSLDLMNKIHQVNLQEVQGIQTNAIAIQSNISDINNDFTIYKTAMDAFKSKLLEMESNFEQLRHVELENNTLKETIHSLKIQQSSDQSRISELQGMVADLQNRLHDSNESTAFYQKEYANIELKYSTVKQNSTDGFRNLISTMDVMKSTIEAYKDGFLKINTALLGLRSQVPAVVSGFISGSSEHQESNSIDTIDHVLSTIDQLSMQLHHLQEPQHHNATNSLINYPKELKMMQDKYTRMRYHVDHVMQFSRQLIASLNIKSPHLIKLKNKLKEFEEASRLI